MVEVERTIAQRAPSAVKVCLVVAFVVLIAMPAVVRAADAPTRTLVVLVDPGKSGVDPAAVRAEIARELRATVHAAAVADAGGTIDVRIGEHTITVVYTERGQQPLSRTVDRPENPAQELEVIALLAGNLARDEARELAEGLTPKPAPKTAPTPADEASPPATAPAAAAPKPAPNPPPAPKTAPPPAQPEPAAEPKAPELPMFPVNLSLFHPISLFPDSHERTILVSLGLAYSRLGRLRGAAVDAGVLRTDVALQGAALSGLWTWSKGTTDGAVVSGLFSTSAGRLRGGELAGLFNLRDADTQGVQTAGLFNVSRALDGGQVSAIVNTADRIRGGQIGLVNVGADLDGMQVGLVNVAGRVRGTQIGLLNVADRVDGASLAPVSILKENRTHLLLWSDTTLITNIGVKYSTGPLYTLVGIGADPVPESQRAFGGGGAIGAHLWRGGAFTADVDLFYRVRVTETDPGQHSSVVRVIAGWELTPLASLFAGGGVEDRVEDVDHVPRGYACFGLQLF